MCWCTPSIRTPCCGGPNCHPPQAQQKADALVHPETNELRPDWQRRVIEEKAQIDERRVKLNDFVTTRTFKALPDEDRALLFQQSAVMSELSLILEKRIRRFT